MLDNFEIFRKEWWYCYCIVKLVHLVLFEGILPENE